MRCYKNEYSENKNKVKVVKIFNTLKNSEDFSEEEWWKIKLRNYPRKQNKKMERRRKIRNSKDQSSRSII